MTTRTDVDRRIAAVTRCRDDNRDLPELVERMDARLDLLHELRDAIPEQRADDA